MHSRICEVLERPITPSVRITPHHHEVRRAIICARSAARDVVTVDRGFPFHSASTGRPIRYGQLCVRVMQIRQ